MTISVEIADRQYDYTDEEVAAEAVAQFQSELNLEDNQVLSIWNNGSDQRRSELEKRIIDAVDVNGSAKRASETVPNGVSLFIGHTDD